MGNRQERINQVLATLDRNSKYFSIESDNLRRIIAGRIVDDLDMMPKVTDNIMDVKEIWWGIDQVGEDEDAPARTSAAIDEIVKIVHAEFPSLKAYDIMNNGYEGNSAQFSPRAITWSGNEFDQEVFYSIMENVVNIAVSRASDQYPYDEDAHFEHQIKNVEYIDEDSDEGQPSHV